MSPVSEPAARRLNAQVHGTVGPWLALCHGFGNNQSSWGPLIEQLGAGRRVLTFDLAYLHPRGRTRLYADVATYADDVLDLLDEQGVTDADFLGHSVGGMIMLAAAVAAPHCARRLFLLNASSRYIDEPGYNGGMSAEALDALLEAMRVDYRQWVLNFAPLAAGVDIQQSGVSSFIRTLLDLGPDIARPVLRSIYELDFRPLLSSVACPTFVLQGPDDVAVSEQATRHLVDAIPSARFVPLDIEGHLPHMVAPDRIADVLLPILDEAS